jgi:hypothetical protein
MLEAIAEAAKHIVIGSAASQAEEGVHINREVRSSLINQTRIQCAYPRSRTDRVVEFNIASQIPDFVRESPIGFCYCTCMLLLRVLSRMSILVWANVAE